MMARRLCWALLAWVLVACSGGSGDLPPVRPTGTVSGNAVDAEIQNGQITVYALGRNGKGERLGGGVTDAQGFYSIELRAASQPVLIEVSGGHYLEEASGVSVNVDDNQVLRAVARYESGQALSVMVTPLTHLAAGLAEFQIAQGMDPAAAVDSALNSMNQLFGLTVTSVLPRNITDPNGATTQLSAPYNYGFFLAALSGLTQWASQQNNVAVHTAYTSLALSQIMYNDIRSDGLLDGRGLNKAGDAMMDLALGTVNLNQNVYRIAVAQHLLAISAGPQNKTGLTRNDLRAAARALATSAHPVFGDNVPSATSAFAPVIVPKLAPGSAFNGVYNFEVIIGSVLGAETVSFDVNGVTIGDAVDPTHPAIMINTRSYADGEYTLGVKATDFLGYSNYQQFTYRFNNIFVNVTSPTITNQAPLTLSGNYSENGLGLKTLTVQDQPVTLKADKTWSAQVDLLPGHNHIPIVIETLQGIREQSEVIVEYDTGAPLIDTSAGHGLACFSKGDGSCNAQLLADLNENAALLILTDHTELAGMAITRATLGGNNIPYFAFAASDPLRDGVGTPVTDLRVRLQYEKNANVITPWRALTSVDGQYLIPLATETLDPAWLRSLPGDLHTLRIEVTDLAGNIKQARLTFKVDFVVAPFTLGTVTDVGQFSSVAFADRASLYSKTHPVVEYSFKNTTGKAFHISPDDNSVHTVDNLIDQLVRQNQARLKTTTEWRAGFIENVTRLNQCPSMPKIGDVNKWTAVTELQNYVGLTTTNPVSVPAPTLSPARSFAEETPSAPLPSDWTQLADFDTAYGRRLESILPGKSLSYDYDYIADSDSLFYPAAVRNWTYVDNTVTPSVTRTCPDVNFLQQRQVFSYQSEPGYPKNVGSTLHEGADKSFTTSGFTVFDVTANTPVIALSGWYLIPAGHEVVVRKQVTLPALTVHDDTDVANPTSFTSYTARAYDRTLTWTIQRPLKLTVQHDGGPGNLFLMSTREVQMGEGAKSYQLSR